MKARRTLRRRIVLVALSGAFSIATVPLLVLGLGHLQALQRRDAELQGTYRQLQRHMAKMGHEDTLLDMGAEAASA